MENPCYSGGCLCGHIRFQARGLPGNPHSCSCDFAAATPARRRSAGSNFRVRPSSGTGRAACRPYTVLHPIPAAPFARAAQGAIDDEPTVALATGSFDRADLPELCPTSHAFADVCPEWWRIDGMR